MEGKVGMRDGRMATFVRTPRMSSVEDRVAEEKDTINPELAEVKRVLIRISHKHSLNESLS